MSDDATARNIVDLAMDDKPNKAGEVMNDILLDKIGQHVQDMKAEISNDMFGQELPEPDAEPVAVECLTDHAAEPVAADVDWPDSVGADPHSFCR